MNAAIQWDEITQALGWALLHFLWQGAAVALLLKAALGTMRKCSALARYAVGCGALVILTLAPIATCWFLASAKLPDMSSVPHALAQARGASVQAVPGTAEKTVVFWLRSPERFGIRPLREWLEPRMPWIVLGWSLGVVLLSARLGISGWLVWRLTRSRQPLPGAEWSNRILGLCQTMGVRRPVQVLQSKLVQVPATLGWIQPIILLPVGCLAGISSGQLEAIVAHELAHIRRHDYLVNLIQSFVEVLLFYHPAVWWISSQIRAERENCCDDLVVSASGDPVGYAEALAGLEAWRGSTSTLALSASGGPLLSRIRRLLGEPPPPRGANVWTIVLIILLATGLSVSGVIARAALDGGGAGNQTIRTGPANAPRADQPQTPAVAQRDASGPPGEQGTTETKPLMTRTFRVDPTTFLESIREKLEQLHSPLQAGKTPLAPPSDIELIREFFTAAGVQFPTSQVAGGGIPGPLTGPAVPGVGKGEAVFYNERTGVLFVRTTAESMATVEKAIQVATATPPQVTIEVKFSEISIEVLEASGLKSALQKSKGPTPFPAVVLITNLTLVKQASADAKGVLVGDRFDLESMVKNEKVTEASVGTLTPAQFKTMMKFFDQSAGSAVLAAPMVTTLSGRQAQVQIVELKNIVTDTLPATPEALNVTAVPLGPSVDLIPYVEADGVTIQMTIIPQLTEFLGYDEPSPAQLAAAPPGTTVPLPRIRTRQTLCNVTARDGETVVVADLGPATSSERKPGNSTMKRLVLFITPTLIDPAGNRIHPE